MGRKQRLKNSKIHNHHHEDDNNNNSSPTPTPDLLNPMMGSSIWVVGSDKNCLFRGTLSGIILRDAYVHTGSGTNQSCQRFPELFLHRDQISDISRDFLPLPQHTLIDKITNMWCSLRSALQHLVTRIQIPSSSSSSSNQEVVSRQILPQDSQNDQQGHVESNGVSPSGSFYKNIRADSSSSSSSSSQEVASGSSQLPQDSQNPDNVTNTKSETDTTRMESDKAWAAMIDKMIQPGSRVKVLTNRDMEFCGKLCGKNERGDLVMRDVTEYDHGDEFAVGGCREAEWEEMVIRGVHISCLGSQN